MEIESEPLIREAVAAAKAAGVPADAVERLEARLRDGLALEFEQMADEDRPTYAQVAEAVRRHFAEP